MRPRRLLALRAGAAPPRRASTVAPATRRGVPQPADDDRTWRDRLGSLKSNGPDGPVGRRNRGPRRKIKQTISSSPDSKPTANSNDARVAAWRAENPEDAAVSARFRVDETKPDTSSDGSSSASASAWITGGEPETERYSFFRASTARYPAYATRATETSYEDSPLDAAAIAASAEALAGVARLDADAYGERSEYATLARIALATHKSGRARARCATRRGRDARERRAGAPPFLFDSKTPVLPDAAAAAADAARAAVPAEAMRERTGAVAGELAGWMFGPSSRATQGGVTTVTIKVPVPGSHRVRRRCASMCKLPAQDVVFAEFGVPLHVEPDFATGRCRMHFGKAPPPESEDPALRAPCLEGCARSAQLRATKTRSTRRETSRTTTGAPRCPRDRARREY